MWRKKDGKSVFTGIVMKGAAFYKLHDPTGDLDGDSHEMENIEFLSEMAQYDGSAMPAPPSIDETLVSMVGAENKQLEIKNQSDDEPEEIEWFPFNVDGAGQLDVSNVRVRLSFAPRGKTLLLDPGQISALFRRGARISRPGAVRAPHARRRAAMLVLRSV